MSNPPLGRRALRRAASLLVAAALAVGASVAWAEDVFLGASLDSLLQYAREHNAELRRQVEQIHAQIEGMP